VLEDLKGTVEQLQIVGVAHARDIPAKADKPCGNVLAECQVGVSLDGDLVTVVDPAEIGELPMSRKRGGLVRDAFHHAAITTEGIRVEVEHLEAGTIKGSRGPARGQRHADTRSQALSQRSSRRLDTASPAVLGMAGALRVELAKALEMVEWH